MAIKTIRTKADHRAALDAIEQRYDGALELAYYAEPAPAAVTACDQTFCGT